jgi:hypothetical protein
MSKPEEILAPSGNGTDATTVVVFTLTTTARNAALPRGYYGNFIRVIPVGANMYWYLAKGTTGGAAASAAVATAASNTGSASGATGATVGSYLANGAERQVLCPNANADETVYICWVGDAAGTFMQVEKSSGKPMTNSDP